MISLKSKFIVIAIFVSLLQFIILGYLFSLDHLSNFAVIAVIITIILFFYLIKLIQEAKKIDIVKSEFISIASHQLRTPLTIINLYTNLLATEEVRYTANQLEYIGAIQTSINRMIRLVRDLLNVSRVEEGKIIIEPEPILFANFIKEVVEEARPFANEKKCKLTYEILKNNEHPILVDKNLIRLAVGNIINNAIIYSPAEKGEVLIDLDFCNNNYVLSIKDNGIGIPKDVQNRIFEKFYRSEIAKKTVNDGTGLGLYLVKKIMESTGGKAWFESVEKKGSTFFIAIPKAGMKKSETGKRLA